MGWGICYNANEIYNLIKSIIYARETVDYIFLIKEGEKIWEKQMQEKEY